ncbi:MAG: hypothetical protein HC918_14235 [Oscillatoriales cyanobacterium SM2_1_8]|nr:hypothetical protein [Oscillatoriales cyanobacterium SM2_1_8]
MGLNATTVYANAGNPTVLKLLGAGDRRVLDVGCGAGDTGNLIRQTLGATVTGFTCSEGEQSAMGSPPPVLGRGLAGSRAGGV